jgi:Photoprotection regulator fluorescence recovery protein
MLDYKWSDSEKKIARRAFDAALSRELSSLLESIKSSASQAATPDDIWALHDLLSEKREEINRKYDYRYSQLIYVFARLLKEKWLIKSDLEGLKEDKLIAILQLREILSQ